jgi:hypothetical protein
MRNVVPDDRNAFQRRRQAGSFDGQIGEGGGYSNVTQVVFIKGL